MQVSTESVNKNTKQKFQFCGSHVIKKLQNLPPLVKIKLVF